MAAAQQGAEFAITATDQTEVAFRAVQANLTKMKAGADAFSAGFGKATAVIAAGLAAFETYTGFRTVAAGLAALDDAAEASGASVQNLSGALAALKPSGIGLDQITDASSKLVRAMQGADEETKSAAVAFKALGIDVRDSAGNLRDPVVVMKELADRLSDYRDGANKTAIAQAIWNKSGAQMLPMLKDLAEAGQLNGKVTAEQAAAAETFEKEMKKLSRASDALKRDIANGLIPTLNDLLVAFNKAREGGQGFFDSIGISLGKKLGLGEWQKDLLQGNIDSLSARRAEIAAGRRIPSGISQQAAIAGIDSQIADLNKKLEGVKTAGGVAMATNLRSSVLYDAEVDPRNKPEAPKIPSAIKKEGDAKSFYQKEIERIDELVAAKKLMAETDGVIYQADLERVKLDAALANGKGTMTAKEKAGYVARLEALRLSEQEILRKETIKKANEQAQQQLVASIDAQRLANESLGKANQETANRILEIGKEGAALLLIRDRTLALVQANAVLDASTARNNGQGGLAVLKEDQAFQVARQRAQAFEEARAQADADLKQRREALQVYGMTEEAIAKVRNARIDEQLAALESQKARLAEAEGNQELIASLERYADALKRTQEFSTREAAMQKLIDQQKEWNSTIRQGIEDLIFSGQKAGDVIKGVVIELAKLEFRRTILDPIFNNQKAGSGGSFLSSLFGQVGGIFGGGGATPPITEIGFANGGVMTSRGPLPLHMYSSGGIATSPQVAVFGEGRSPEAFVPLPNGRSIPVQMRGAGGGSVVINQTINAAPGTSAADLRAAMLVAKNEALAELSNQLRRGGPLRDQVRSVA